MIQEIRIKNYLSFRDEVVLSFEATKDTTFEECQVVNVTPKVRLLRFALIYGANASGKSNLLNAMDFLRDFWFDKKSDIDEETGVVPFLLDTETPNDHLNSTSNSLLATKDIGMPSSWTTNK